MRIGNGSAGGARSSALWGTGSRGGDSRANALWGKGSRGLVTMIAAAFLLGVPLAATAGSGQHASARALRHLFNARHTWISPALLRAANRHPQAMVRVIIQSDQSVATARAAFRRADETDGVSNGSIRKKLALINGIAVNVKAQEIPALLKTPGLTVTPDAPVHLAGNNTLYSSKQLWVPNTGIDRIWRLDSETDSPPAPTIAIVDSGVDASRADFGGRVIQQVNLTTLPNNSPGDGRGHGTFVAGIAAGSAPGYAGASPTSNIVSLDVMDDSGTARTSDVIAAAQWILANKDTYNIKVANFSLHSSSSSNFTRDPLDKAVEQLWFNGVTVVAAAGNYGNPDTASGVKYAPGNDPFVITVGAADMNGDPNPKDDTAAPWSAYGYTNDGFAKPEVATDGRYMVGPIPPNSTLAALKAQNMVSPGYIQLSGTSFAAPIVSGIAAQILARRPNLTPDQIKGALMATARPTPLAKKLSTGVGEVNAVRSITMPNPPNANAGLDQYIVTDATGNRVFDGQGWYTAAKANPAWNAATYSAGAWDSAALASVSWQDVSWNDVSWQDVSVSAVSWADVSWNDVSWEDAAEGDPAAAPNAYTTSPTDLAAAAADPALALDPATVDPAAAGATVAPTETTTTTDTTTTTATTTTATTTTPTDATTTPTAPTPTGP